MKRLRGKNCLITGAASGIGRHLAYGLAREGMNLYLADLDTDGLARVREEIDKYGVKVFTGRCDVSKHGDLEKVAEAFYSLLGDMDVLVNNAGVAGAGIVGIPYHAQYIASKFTVVGITEALYSEIKHTHRDLHFSVICPTYLRTNLIDRTPVSIPYSLLTKGGKEEIEGRMDEFKSIFWGKYTKGAPAVDRVVKKYIRGIKKNKLYIFDMARLRLAMVLKGICEPLYRLVLRSEGKRHLKMIEDSLTEMGIQTRGRT